MHYMVTLQRFCNGILNNTHSAILFAKYSSLKIIRNLDDANLPLVWKEYLVFEVLNQSLVSV